MSTQDKRIKKIEQRVALNEEEKEPLFIEWAGNPWMPEEEADVRARHPDCDGFYKSMMPRIRPYRPEDQDRPILRTLNGSQYGAWKTTPEERKRHRKFDRASSPAAEERRQKQIQRLRDYMNEANGLPPRPGKEEEPIEFDESSENPWTEEEKAAVLAKHPECDWFSKAPSPDGPLYGMDPALRTLDGSPYITEKKQPWIIYSLEDARRKGYGVADE